MEPCHGGRHGGFAFASPGQRVGRGIATTGCTAGASSAGADLGGHWSLGLWYEEVDPGCPLWKLSEVVGGGCRVSNKQIPKLLEKEVMEPSALLLSPTLWGEGLGAIKIQNRILNLIPSLNKVCCAFCFIILLFRLLAQTSE